MRGTFKKNNDNSKNQKDILKSSLIEKLNEFLDYDYAAISEKKILTYKQIERLIVCFGNIHKVINKKTFIF